MKRIHWSRKEWVRRCPVWGMLWVFSLLDLSGSSGMDGAVGIPRSIFGGKQGSVVIDALALDQSVNGNYWRVDEVTPGFSDDGWLVFHAAGRPVPCVGDRDIRERREIRIDYWVSIAEAGPYDLRIWNHRSPTEFHNLAFASIDLGPAFPISNQNRTSPSWSDGENCRVVLSAGVHRVSIFGGLRDFRFSRIVLAKADENRNTWMDVRLAPSDQLDVRSAPPTEVDGLRVDERGPRFAVLNWEHDGETALHTDYVISIDAGPARVVAAPPAFLDGLSPFRSQTISVARRDGVGRQSALQRIDLDPVKVTVDYPIFRLDQPPMIDGHFDSLWRNLPRFDLQDQFGISGSLYLGWNHEGLFGFASVDKTTAALQVELGAQREIILALDPKWTQSEIADVGQLFRLTHWQFPGVPANRLQADGIRQAFGDSVPAPRPEQPNREGYSVEWSISWSELGVEGRADTHLGWALGIPGSAGLQVFPGSESLGGEHGMWCHPYRYAVGKLVRGMSVGSVDGWLPRQVWRMSDGIAVIEPECIDLHEHWVFTTEAPGFSGEGYLVWEGPDRMETPDGRGGNYDYTFERIGPQEEWMIVNLEVEQRGFYRIDVRNIHEHEDGDNDAWIDLVGRFVASGDHIQRIGDSHMDGKSFTWLDWGVQRYWLREGMNHIMIGGRSVGFGIDRIIVYADDETTSRMARELTLLISQMSLQQREWEKGLLQHPIPCPDGGSQPVSGSVRLGKGGVESRHERLDH